MKRICVFTGTRAEYGLLSSLIKEIKSDKALKLQIVVSGSHLSKEFGSTYKEIEREGFKIDAKVKIPLGTDTSLGLSRSMSLALEGLTKTFKALKPDIVVVLGDRFEAFSAAVAATVSKIPIAHIHGGELTFGVMDEVFRHSITKMSHLHFTSTESYRRRVIQLGEFPKRVFNVGALGVDNINKIKLISKNTLEKQLKFKFRRHNLLITFHPSTLAGLSDVKKQFKELLYVLSEIKDTGLIFTKANADTGGHIINKMIDDYVLRNKNEAIAFASMGQIRYLSALKIVDAVIGNSSSGIIEAPSFKIGTVNIGDRQEGRIRAKSVIDCGTERKDIEKALKRLYSGSFQNSLKKVINPYEQKNTANRIKSILKNKKVTLKKEFYDI